MGERRAEAARIAARERVERPFGERKPARRIDPGAQHVRAHHRCDGERDDGRHQHHEGERQGKLAEHAPYNAGHEQQRDKDGDQREGQRDDGEADLARALQRRLQRALAVLHIALDVLDHHDGVVDDKARADGQRHQRQIVEAEARQPHGRKGRDDGQRQRHGGDRHGAQVAQEKQHDEHDERHGKQQRELHFRNRGADAVRAVVDDLDPRAGGNGPLQAWQFAAQAVERIDDIGTRLLLQIENDGGAALVPAADARVLQPLDHLGHIAQ